MTLLVLVIGRGYQDVTLNLCCPFGYNRTVEKIVINQNQLKRCRHNNLPDITVQNSYQ